MWIKIVLIAVGVLLAALITIIAINRARLNSANAQLVKELVAAAESPADQVFRPADLAGLPAPVQRYLTKAIPAGQPTVKTVRLHQTGEFRLGDRTAPWKPMAAEQHFTVTPPGFVWDATIEMAPLMPARVIDAYRDGQGMLRAKLLSTVTVADVGVSAELNQGELMRYLGEAVWFPTALLPGSGVQWSPIDDRSAEATLRHAGNEASVTFYFNDRDEVERIHADRWYQRDDGGFDLVPWTGYWFNYQTINGFLIPTEGRVEWNLPDGDKPYWQASLDMIEYTTSD